MLDIDQERRTGQRITVSRPCKVFEPRSRRYVAGSTCNVNPGGMLLRLDRRLPLEPGDVVYVGVARKRQAVLRSDDLLEARVVRLAPMSSGACGVAVCFAEPTHREAWSDRRAA